MQTTSRDEAFRALIQQIKKCEKRANELELEFLPQLLSAAQIEAAIQWEGGSKALGEPPVRYESLIRMKIRLALSSEEGGVLPMFLEPANSSKSGGAK
jgi:hypothetical protein